LSNEVYRVEMDGEWELDDLYAFPHAFGQVYAFIYCFDSELSARDAARIDHALESYPWGGGYSIVNIYTVLQNQVEAIDRPRIVGIKYLSPGWIDILLNLDPAIKLAGSVAAVAGSLAAAAKAFNAIQKALYDIRAQRGKAKVEEIKLTRAQIQELLGLTKDLAKLMKFDKVAALEQRTGDPEVAAKLVAAQFRRLKTLAEFQTEGKATLPGHPRKDAEELE
jgi:hypothetical protein